MLNYRTLRLRRLFRKNWFYLEIGFTGFLHGEKPENRKKTKNWFRICLNIFLNSLFNVSSAPSDRLDECIGYSEVGSNQRSTPELVLFHGIFSLRLCLRVPLWITRYMSLAYRRRWLRWPEGRPKRKIGYVGFFVSVSGFVFFQKPPHSSRP